MIKMKLYDKFINTVILAIYSWRYNVYILYIQTVSDQVFCAVKFPELGTSFGIY
jgi:hypothetical protein